MESTDPIIIRGAKENNLKNISLEIPSQRFVVITGPSGSGKSSLAFDTLFAEGQRRYMESLSTYARQFLEQLAKPNVDFVDGLSPAIAIEQKTISQHPRSTVGTVTEIYDFLRLLYARRGEVRDVETGEVLKASTDEEITESILSFPEGGKVQLFASVVRGRKGEYLREFEQWRRAGFSKVRIDGKIHNLHDPILIAKHQHHDIDILIDSFPLSKTTSGPRVSEALKICTKVSEGWLRVVFASGEEQLFGKTLSSSNGQSFPDLEPRLFSFNSPYGMCPKCKGLGLLEKKSSGKKDRDEEEDEELLFESSMDGFETCGSCNGTRLRPESLSVFFANTTIAQISQMSCLELTSFFQSLAPSIAKHPVTARLLDEISKRLRFLIDVGVGYLSMDRRSGTLSGGEAQRIRLATQLGTQLSGVMYVLDEPSIGLHPRDHQKLIDSLTKLRDLGNSVIVVEHDEETMLAADYIIDVGPGAGIHGGNIITAGTPTDILKEKSITSDYLSGRKSVTDQRARRPGNDKLIELKGCSGHNLKNVDLALPLGKFIVFTGVSGSGKSSLVQETLESAIAKKLYRSSHEPLAHKELLGLENIDKLVHVDQRAIGRSPRSNPATYTGLFSALRTVFSQTPDAQIRGYTPGTFSFNVKGGRCDACEGAGRIKIEMHFLPDVYVPCETCNGTRYRREVLEVRFKGKSISDILNMSIEEAHPLFENQFLIEPKLRTLLDVGLGYIKLGQPAVTLSGGEAQRIKLAKELSKRSTGKTLYFLDEPTTGLHFDDIKKLLDLLQRLADLGNTIVVIEHNLDVVCAADWIIDIGPGAGHAGGNIVYQGTPEGLAKQGNSTPTSSYVADYFTRRKWHP